MQPLPPRRQTYLWYVHTTTCSSYLRHSDSLLTFPAWLPPRTHQLKGKGTSSLGWALNLEAIVRCPRHPCICTLRPRSGWTLYRRAARPPPSPLPCTITKSAHVCKRWWNQLHALKQVVKCSPLRNFSKEFLDPSPRIFWMPLTCPRRRAPKRRRITCRHPSPDWWEGKCGWIHPSLQLELKPHPRPKPALAAGGIKVALCLMGDGLRHGGRVKC